MNMAMHVTFIWTLNTCKLFKLKAHLGLFCSSGYSWAVCVQASLKYLRKIFLFIFISTTMSYGVCQLGFLELTKDENDHLMANYVLVQTNLFLVSENFFLFHPYGTMIKLWPALTAILNLTIQGTFQQSLLSNCLVVSDKKNFNIHAWPMLGFPVDTTNF